MSRHFILVLSGTCLLACAPLSGCSHSSSRDTVATAVPPVAGDTNEPVSPVQAVLRPPEPAPAVPAVQQIGYQQTSPAAAPVVATRPALATPAQAGNSSPAAFPRGERVQPPKPCVDITAQSCFGHAADYSWLSGQVEYSRLSNAWRLRFASVDEDDPYGGSVTLTGEGLVSKFADGARVRVKGYLVNPEDKCPSPTYHINSFGPIE
jgi:hypothetical protein